MSQPSVTPCGFLPEKLTTNSTSSLVLDELYSARNKELRVQLKKSQIEVNCYTFYDFLS